MALQQKDSSFKFLSRRQFILGGSALFLSALLGLRFLLPRKNKLSLPQLKLLSEGEATILSSIYLAMTSQKDPEEGKKAVLFLDQFLGNFRERVQWEFKMALKIIEHTPLLFNGYFSRFSQLDFESRENCLKGWMSGARWRVPIFGAMKELSFMAYYAQDKNYAQIGYTGPIVEGNEIDPDYNQKYLEMVAPK